MAGVWITWRLAVEVGCCRKCTGTLRNVPSSAAMLISMEKMYVAYWMCMHVHYDHTTTYPTVLDSIQLHCPSHPKVPGYPDISHCIGSLSVALSFPSQSPGIPGHIPLYWVSLSRIVLPIPKSRDIRTYPTVLGLSQSHCPSHPKVLGYPDISHCIGSLLVPLSFPSQIHAILISSVSQDCGMGRTVGLCET